MRERMIRSQQGKHRDLPLQVWAAIVIILLLAAFLRIYRIRTMPWGLSQDEVGNAETSLSLLEGGKHVPFLAGGYGHEPLFHYLQAATLRLFGDNVIGIRMPAVATGMVLVAASYALMRRLAGPVAALTTAGGLTVSWWPIIFSRIGIRAITFPTTLTLAVLLLWKGLVARRRVLVSIAGLLFGLTAYTYTSTIILPALALAWLACAALFQWKRLRRHWQALLGVGLIAAAVAAPLALYLYAHPELQERVQQLQGPLTALRQGNLRPVGRAILATLGMFSRSGEGRWTYGIPGRPVLGPLSGALFYLGAMRCIVQIRRPACGLLGIWLLVGLVPSMITPDAPSSIRAIGALPAAYGILGVGAEWLWHWARDRGRLMARAFLIVLSLIGVLHAGWTFRDGLGNWALHPEVYWLYKAHFADIAAFLDAQADPRPMVVFEEWVNAVDINGLQRDMVRDERQPRWAQGGRSFIWPAEAKRFTLAMPIYSTVDDVVWELFARDPIVAAKSAYRMPDGRPGVTFYTIESEPRLSNVLERASNAPVMLPQSAQPVRVPVNFGDQIAFLGYRTLNEAEPGGELRVITLWRILRDSPEPLTLFIHLLDSDGELVAQHDGFDAWVDSLHRGDIVAQLHTVSLEEEVSSGSYRLQVGAYNAVDRKRLVILSESERSADRLWLDRVEVEP